MDRAKKKFANALDGLRSQLGRTEVNIEVEEKLQADFCCLRKIVRHGFPEDARCLAYDPVQRLLAIGTGKGIVRILGDAGVDYQLTHATQDSVLQMQFLVNEGALITACANDMIHLWNYRQKNPEIVHSLQMAKESVSTIHLPFNSRWLLLGTDKGNVYFVSVSSFTLSSYVINWNKAIDIACRVHPGAVRQLASSPIEPNKIVIVFDKGVVAVWNLATREAERLPMDPPVKCVCWHYDGRSLMTGNVDGSISVYNARKFSDPPQRSTPHGTGTCRPVHKVEWRHNAEGEPYVIFSGGLPTEDNLPIPAITVLRAQKSATVMELEHQLITFCTLNQVCYENIPQQPTALAVLLKNSLMVIDLLTTGGPANYPAIDCPHALDIHESPVTCVFYLADCSSDLIGALTLVGCKQRRKGLSERPWPVNGGVARECATGHQELVLTGHKDGSVRFWQASGEHLQILYRLKSASHFERLEETDQLKDASHAVKRIDLCVESRLLLITGQSGQVTLFRFSKVESTNTIAVVNIPLLGGQPPNSGSSVVEDRPSTSGPKEIRRQKKIRSRESRESTHSSDTSDASGDERILPFKVRGAPMKRPAGYQPELSCLIPWRSNEVSETVTATALNSAYGVIALGTPHGLALVDIAQCALIYAWTSSELYGSDPTPAVQLSQGDASPGDISPRPVNGGALTPEDELDEVVIADEAFEEQQKGRPAGRSHSVKSGGGIMRRLTNKGHSIARSLSLHVHQENGDAMPAPLPSRADRLSSHTQCSPSTSSHSLNTTQNGNTEGVTSLTFIYGCGKRNDVRCAPCLWVGTSGGATIALNLILPQDRLISTVVIAPTGTVVRLKGPILYETFMDSAFCLVAPAAENYKETSKESKDSSSPEKSLVNKVLTKESLSPSLLPSCEAPSAEEMSQMLIAVSEWEIRVIALPSLATLYQYKCTEIPLAKARQSHIRGHPALVVLTAAGQMSVFSLPSLRPLNTTQLLSHSVDIDDPVCQRLSISEHGLGMYMASQSEMEKYTVCGELADQVSDSIGELFVPMDMPEAPKNAPASSFLKGIFSGGTTPRDNVDLDNILLDKEKTATVGMRSVGKTIPGPSVKMDRASSSAVTAGQAAQMALQNLNERSEKLNQTVDATERLRGNAESLSARTGKLVEKYEKKKWYQI